MAVLSAARPLSLAAFLLSLALAGCAGGDGGSNGDGEPVSAGATSTGPALTAVIQVLANGSAVAPANGSVPAEAGVALTFDGSGSTGAVVEYAWDFGDNATGSDEVVDHAYAAGGLYEVTLTVTGLGNASATARVRVDVAPDPSGAFLFTAVHPVEGELPLMNPNSCTNQGVDCQDHVIPVVAADGNGTAAVARAVRVSVTGSGAAAVDLQVFWRGPDGTTLNSTEASGLEHTLEYSGDMPAGDYVLRVRLFVGAQASYTGSVEVDYVQA